MTGTFTSIVIGASAGSLDALSTILPILPADYPLPISIVVHLPVDNKNIFISLLQDKCRIFIKEAEDKEPIEPGKVYFAPPDYHLLMEDNHVFSLSNEQAVLFSRPSIDVLFESAADAYGEGLLGIVLTGASHDGAKGLKTIIKGGGKGIVQDPSTAFSSVMPKAAIEHCPTALVMSLPQIAEYLLKVPEL